MTNEELAMDYALHRFCSKNPFSNKSFNRWTSSYDKLMERVGMGGAEQKIMEAHITLKICGLIT